MLERIKKDPVLFISGILAVVSCFFVHPDMEYAGYVDFRVLAILFCMMLVVSELVLLGVFDKLTNKLLSKVHSSRMVSLILVWLAFFMGMILTNDVTLVTLVPFAIALMKSFDDRKTLTFTLILMTVATNLGSMQTPVGNPQNLYMYGLTGMSLSEFLAVMIPYSVVSFILLAACIIFIPDKNKELKSGESTVVVGNFGSKTQILIYGILFVLAFLTVLRILPFFVFVIAVFTVVGGMDYKILLRADYILLLTFIGFFIFTGNMARIDFISNWLKNLIEGKEFFVSIIASQFISNVPATLMLSGFTDNYRQLMAGVNVGGLGTLIASMASLISYKAYTKEYKENSAKYIKVFTIYNLVFLLFMVLLWFIAGRK